MTKLKTCVKTINTLVISRLSIIDITKLFVSSYLSTSKTLYQGKALLTFGLKNIKITVS